MDNIQLQPERNIAPIPSHTHNQGFVPEQLLERDRQRHEEILLRRQNIDLSAEEHPDYFAQKFSDLAAVIRESIIESEKSYLHKPIDLASHDEVDSPQEKFSSLATRIGELQRYLTASTRFLPDYKIKACTQIINELNKSLDESRQKVIPKKKFGFNSRKTVKKPTKIDNSSNEKEKSDPSKPIAVDNTSVINSSTFASTLSLNRNHFSRHNEYIIETRENINKHDVTLVNLQNCFIELRGHPSSVRADNLTNCIVLMGPVSSSVYVENCQNTTFAIACQQLRCHNSTTCRIFLHVTCRAIIEDCKNIEFGDYNYSYEEIKEDFLESGLDRSVNNNADVADFNWLSPHAPSPNWSLMHHDTPFDFESLRRNFQAKLEFEPDVKQI